MEKDKHYVYILECSDGSYYTGYTNNLEKRIEMHQTGKGAKYTRGRTPVQLLFSEVYESKTEAMQEEYRVKQLTRKQKEEYMYENAAKEL
ncbi:GIY-YIG nuclease family protein [Schinkia azotoformans]|uniref:GIY-YIG nuclease family protein n=1 Tax=Schinkia azotoformans TaxID=1454 RepID=UPI002DBF13D7|nr:GIY-YIG nuclease family protein [Schinkia azotoformans]MEC1719969.1 GIY-YIG nuclease family protein [Schinkia azotoformans]MED4415337.1 GIY-YIG nuclease family protein [Schinkia azotoformans]